MSYYDEYGSSWSDAYGTDANFQTNYRLTQSFVDAHKAPFVTANRIWIGGYNAFQADISDYDALLTSEGILHTTGPSTLMSHSWDGGWVPEALAALEADSTQLGSTNPPDAAPEASAAVLFPVSALLLGGAFYSISRTRPRVRLRVGSPTAGSRSDLS